MPTGNDGEFVSVETQIREWMKSEKDSYLAECEGAEDALSYMVNDCPYGDEAECEAIGKEVLGLVKE